MLLQRLSEYATQRMGMPPTLYDMVPIAGIIDLDTRHSDKPTLISTINPANRDEKWGIRRLAPQIAKTSGIKPTLFASNAEYTLGLARENSKPERVAACHTAYMDILTRCAATTKEPSVKAVLDFLSSPDPAGQLNLPDDFDPGGFITFQVDGEFPMDRPSVRRFWAAEHDPASATAKKSAHMMQCLVCGQRLPVLERMQGTIKRIPGGQSSGTLIVSANAEAFESYGLEASLTSPICSSCGEKYTKALNGLIADEQHHFFLGGSVFVFWTREPTTFSLLNTLITPDVATVKRLPESLWRGEETLGLDPNAFYAVSLSGSGGRAVVRDWIDTTVGDVQRHLGQWFERQRIVGSAGEETEPIGLFRLAEATVRDRNDLGPLTARTLLRTALSSAPLSWDLLTLALHRNQVEPRQVSERKRIAHPRAALIKLVLASHGKIKEGTLVQLEPDATFTSDGERVAYHCGRLLAALENLQQAAIPGVSVTVGDRYYGAAAANPAATFGRLLQGAKHHQTKIQRDKPGAANRIHELLDEIDSHLTYMPHALTLEERGFFGLGYYHQGAALRSSRQDAIQRLKARQAETDIDESGNNA